MTAPKTIDTSQYLQHRGWIDGATYRKWYAQSIDDPQAFWAEHGKLVAHVTQCPFCIQGHTKAAAREGASGQEIMEAIWVATERRAGGAFAHSALALSALDAMETR